MTRLIALSLFSLTACGQDGLRFAELKDWKLQSGRSVPVCRIGYRTFGSLNGARSNAVLFPTWFSGTSADLEGLIGPGKLVDSSQFFVIAFDAPGNGVSCSPTNTPDFPPITVGDMVEAEFRFVTEILKIRKLHAVIGISMGGMQTFQWMVAHPDAMTRAVPIIGSPRLNNSDRLLWQAQLGAIEVAAKCGDARAAMPAVLAMHNFALRTPDWQQAQPGSFQQLMSDIGKRAREGMDPRDWASQLRAMMAQDVSRPFGGSMEKAAGAVKAPALVVLASQDHMVHPGPAREFARLAKLGVLELTGDCGHMATSCESGKMTPAVQAFLARQ